MPPQVSLGLPLYRGEAHLREALESLLGQTYGDFRIVVLDDGPTDCGEDISREYERMDARLHYERNPRRIGMTTNWHRCFDRARELWGQSPYFAWVSDHDVWHPRWLGALVRELQEEDGAVLAYSLSLGISEDGVVVREPWTFETRDIPTLAKRFQRTCYGMVAGSMVYGLFRSEPLARCGVFRSLVLPDRQLLSELSLHGRFNQVPEILWYRRYRRNVTASLDRQRASFWPEGPPWWSRVWWPLTHTAAIGHSTIVKGNTPADLGRMGAVAMTAAHLPLAAGVDARSRWRKQLRKRWHRLKRSRHVLEAGALQAIERLPVAGRAAPLVKSVLRALHGVGLRTRRAKALSVLAVAHGRTAVPGLAEMPQEQISRAREQLARLRRHEPPAYLAGRLGRGGQ